MGRKETKKIVSSEVKEKEKEKEKEQRKEPKSRKLRGIV